MSIDAVGAAEPTKRVLRTGGGIGEARVWLLPLRPGSCFSKYEHEREVLTPLLILLKIMSGRFPVSGWFPVSGRFPMSGRLRSL
jgi:hypothetical protein